MEPSVGIVGIARIRAFIKDPIGWAWKNRTTRPTASMVAGSVSAS
jgi:hypothetical protein